MANWQSFGGRFKKRPYKICINQLRLSHYSLHGDDADRVGRGLAVGAGLIEVVIEKAVDIPGRESDEARFSGFYQGINGDGTLVQHASVGGFILNEEGELIKGANGVPVGDEYCLL